MFLVLDTNHFTEFSKATLAGQRLRERLEEKEASVFSCIVAAEESLQGWLAMIHGRKPGRDQLEPYKRLHECLESLFQLTILPFDDEAATHFHRLKEAGIRMGAMDLKIAAICMAHDVLLLSRNLVDFAKVPDLRVENWLD